MIDNAPRRGDEGDVHGQGSRAEEARQEEVGKDGQREKGGEEGEKRPDRIRQLTALKSKAITSEQNQVFKDLRKLLTSRGIQEQGRALLAGDKVIPEVVGEHPSSVETWITPDGGPPPPLAVPWITLAPALFDELDLFGTRAPLVVVRVPELAAFDDAATWPPGCTLLVAFQNPDNVGAVIRTAAAFGVARIVLLKESAHPFHPKAMRAAGTALLKMAFLRGPSISALHVRGAHLVALDAGGASLVGHAFPERFALLPGVEGPGLPMGMMAGTTLAIPMRPGIESLNAATATALALYEWARTKR